MKIKLLDITKIIEETKFENYKIMLKDSVDDLHSKLNDLSEDFNAGIEQMVKNCNEEELKDLANRGLKYIEYEEEVAGCTDLQENYKSVNRLIDKVTRDIVQLINLFDDLEKDFAYADEVATQLENSNENDRIVAKGIRFAANQTKLSYWFLEQMLDREYDIIGKLAKIGKDLSKKSMNSVSV